MNFYENSDKKFETQLNELRKYEIDDLDELIKLLKALKYTGDIEKLEDIERTDVLSFFDFGWGMKEEEYPLLKTIHGGFKRSLLKTSLTNYDDFKELYKVVKTAYIFNNKEWENEENINETIISICQKLVYYIEYYGDHEITPEYSLEYVKQFQDIRWADEIVEEFKLELENSVDIIQEEPFVDCKFPVAMNKAATFLMVCNAVKENRQAVAFNDIITAYLTILKMIIKNSNKVIMDLETGKIIKTKKKMWTSGNIFYLIVGIIGLLLLLIRFIAAF